MSARLEPYWGIHHGEKNWLKDMEPAVEHIIFQYLKNGEAVAQYPLPDELGGRPRGDMLIHMPSKVREKEDWEAKRVVDIRRELKEMKRISD